jgi:hypothetical protein
LRSRFASILAKPEFKEKYLKTIEKINPRLEQRKEKHKAFKKIALIRVFAMANPF